MKQPYRPGARSQAVAEPASRRFQRPLLALLVAAFALAFADAARAADRPAAFMKSVGRQLIAAARSGSPHKMAEVIQKFVEKLPPAVKQILSACAAIRGQTIHALVYDMCQKWYDKAVNSGE